MVADGLFNPRPDNNMSYPLQMVHSSSPQLIFNSSPLSLALQPKRENTGEMGFIGKGFDNNVMGKTREDEAGSPASDNFEAASGDDHETLESKSSKRKKYHRHTPFQIQELEACFKENPHPDEKSRLELGRRLGLDVRQVKFWFQNRRTQIKTQLERHENSILKQENDKLRIENITMKEAMRSPMCNNCGSPAILGEVPIEHHHLMIENARLKDELNRLGVLANKFLGTPAGSMHPVMGNSRLDLGVVRDGLCTLNYSESPLPLGLDFGDRGSSTFPMGPPSGLTMGISSVDVPVNKSVFLDLALAAMNELIKLSQLDSPIWFQSLEGGGETLNQVEYRKTFSPCTGVSSSNFATEATRYTGTVMLDCETIMETFLDVNRWTEMFPWIIGSASTHDVIFSGSGGKRNGVLLLMEAEFQLLSPLVPIRQAKFLRFCKQHKEDIWAVVDVSTDTIFQNPSVNASVSCKRLPSGTTFVDMFNGSSKVTWIEHMEFDESAIHEIYKPLLRSGIGFGAQKWISILKRQCELVATITSSTVPTETLTLTGKKSLAKLAQRMTRNFCTGVCSTVHKWEMLQNEISSNDTKLAMRQSFGDLGEPSGVILSATTTVWMPVSPIRLFDFLQDEKARVHWDVLSQDGPIQQILYLPKSQDPGNGISILRGNAPPTNRNGVLIFQDTFFDSSGSLIVHAAVDITGINMVLSGGDSTSLSFLPSGFAILPDCFSDSSKPPGANDCGGSFLTLGFQILVNNLPAAKLTMESIDTVKSLIARTLHGIKTGLDCN
ncbi:homeobox-leucine zipper protein ANTHOCYANINLESS 2 [Dorcoceras hygrometricum]|uniref:Homeobox-leucine zipper protein ANTHOCYANINLESS 2 n=1 Tax=Dorcoceras hygrometricum TaxID=472368 RepID=A0A2Z7C8P2_9LAMI|nr:homeobox-leucine zipper protein ANTHOCYANINLESS 2 [Dorcoceras hygrometricum]